MVDLLARKGLFISTIVNAFIVMKSGVYYFAPYCNLRSPTNGKC